MFSKSMIEKLLNILENLIMETSQDYKLGFPVFLPKIYFFRAIFNSIN